MQAINLCTVEVSTESWKEAPSLGEINILYEAKRERGEQRESGSYSDQGIMTHSEMSVEGRDVSLGDDSVEDVAVFFVSHRSFAQEKTEEWDR